MKLFAYRVEIQSRQASLGRIRRLKTRVPFMLGTQFLCLTTLNTSFQIAVNKLVLYQMIKFYKGKEVLLEVDKDDISVRFVKAHLGWLFKHELEALKHKYGLMSLDGHAIHKSTDYKNTTLA